MSVAKTDLVNCPNCGHSAYDHWTLKGAVWDDATKGQNPHILMKHLGVKDGGWVLSISEYACNSHPGAIEKNGCFKAIGEYFKPNMHDVSITWQNWGWNYYEFCECPIDRDTCLALIRQGKTFTGTLADDLANPPTDKWPNQAIEWCQNNPVPDGAWQPKSEDPEDEPEDEPEEETKEQTKCETPTKPQNPWKKPPLLQRILNWFK